MEDTLMLRNPKDFRDRYNRWKEGKDVYKAGRPLPAYDEGNDTKYTTQQKETISKVYNYFKKLGYDDVSIAGMLGNALSESSLNPDSISKSNYRGLWQNSADMHSAIVGTYGNHNLNTQMQYVDDWVNGANNVRKGKHSSYLAMNHSKFKKSGYANAKDAADAFMKLYERPVIMKDGKVVGYQKDAERKANAVLMYDYLTNTFGNGSSIMVRTDGDGNKTMTFPLPDWTKSENRIPQMSLQQLEDATVYPPAVVSPEYLNPYNNANSPAYGGTNPRIKGIQEIYDENKRELERVLPDTVVTGKTPSPFSPPTLAELMSEGKEKWVKDITGAPSIYDDQSSNPTINPFMIPTIYANGGKDIYIKPSKRGTFTAAAKKHGKSVQAFASQVLANPGNYSPAMRKKAQFAKNSSKWSH